MILYPNKKIKNGCLIVFLHEPFLECPKNTKIWQRRWLEGEETEPCERGGGVAASKGGEKEAGIGRSFGQRWSGAEASERCSFGKS